MHDEYLCDLIPWVTWKYSIDAMYCSNVYFYVSEAQYSLKGQLMSAVESQNPVLVSDRL